MSSEEPAEFVERILDDAVARHASDIYFLPRMDRLEVRYRGDGVQCDVESDHAKAYDSDGVTVQVAAPRRAAT